MKVAIIGFGVESQSSLRYWQSKGASVTICGRNEHMQVPEGINVRRGDHYLDGLDQFDVIMRTAGINPQGILDKNPDVESKILTAVDLFLQECPTTKQVIGVTGTKGKGTTSTLIAKILEASGKRVFLGGNIGLSPLDFLPDLTPDDWVVLELSSFQLQDIKHSPHIAVCLMVTPEHLNWHKDMADYTQAKQQLFAHQTANDIAIYFANSETSHTIANASPGSKIPYFAEPGAFVQDSFITINNHHICATGELKLLGQHNWQNVCAAITASWQVTKDTAAMRQVLTTFNGLEHRLEFVREFDGVSYYDDSFGTTPETAIVALQAFPSPKVVILGGSDKGAEFDALAQVVIDNNVRNVLLIGDMAAKIQAALEAKGFTAFSPGGSSMTDIVANAKRVARPDDVVLLSTACASFDMFKDYKDRGNQFKTAVKALI